MSSGYSGGEIHARCLELSIGGSDEPDNFGTFVSSPENKSRSSFSLRVYTPGDTYSTGSTHLPKSGTMNGDKMSGGSYVG